jgi:hypothetical protein
MARAAAKAQKPAPPARLGTTLEEVEEVIRQLKQDRRDAELDPAMTLRNRAVISTSLAAALRQLSRVRGETELTARQVIESPHFGRVLDALIVVLRPHREAWMAVRAELKRIVEAG